LTIVALVGVALAPAVRADHIRTSTVLALQDDVNYLDDSIAALNARQQQRFQRAHRGDPGRPDAACVRA
jgi:hypothetical protein